MTKPPAGTRGLHYKTKELLDFVRPDCSRPRRPSGAVGRTAGVHGDARTRRVALARARTGRQALGVARLEWDSAPDPRSAAELLAGTQSSALAEAVEWLNHWGSEHPGPASAAQPLADASEAGISRMTLYRARKKLGLGTAKTADGWVVDR
jgi:hypothetical protein